MRSHLTADELTVAEAEMHLPSVSIILPFNIKITAETEAKQKLKVVLENVEKQLSKNYDEEQAGAVLARLDNLLDDIDLKLCKKSIAIFVSPTVEEIFYLDMPVEEEILIDEAFDIRSLVVRKKASFQYLAILISAETTKTFWFNGIAMTEIKMAVPSNTHAFENDMHDKTGSFSDASSQKEILLDKFLRHTDEGLSHLLATHSCPVFMLGVERDLGHFKKITKNEKSIAGWVHGNFIRSSEYEIQNVLKPFINGLENTFQQALVHKLEHAGKSNTAVFGIADVWAAAIRGDIKLLVTEKDYLYPAYIYKDAIYNDEAGVHRGIHTKDAVSIIMQKVLETGGEIELTDNGVLAAYQHIAAIKYY